MSAPSNTTSAPSHPDPSGPVLAPAQTMAALERTSTPAPAGPQTIAGLQPLTPSIDKTAPKDDHPITAATVPKIDPTPVQNTATTPGLPDRHSGATPAPQVAPVSVIIPASASSTTTVITVPPEPEHITIAPTIPPVLAAAPKEQPQRVTAEPSKAHEAPHHPVERVDTLADLPSHTAPRSRRNSASDSTPATRPRPSSLPIPSPSRAASSGDLRSGQPSPMIPINAVEVLVASVHLHHNAASPAHQHADPLSLVNLYAGKNKKLFSIHRHLLVTKVPYFHEMFSHDAAPGVSRLTFENLDEYAFAFFQHYLGLYVLALKFNVESLQNEAIDLCRQYYHLNSMTAPAYRIEYIYAYTSEPNHMRNFLVATAAYRSLCEAPSAPGVYLSDSMKTLMAKEGDLGIDFAESLIKLSKNGLVDVRKGDACIFHVHSDGKVCQTIGLEPYQDA
ncbi:hypothetical protein BDZ85DRAFT_283025 [Elsinoe ampelina]|uniref:BTB domain-containing protein n=1 Tax=Elsinoe ampelina TaxID=302913 RepID=A0A6A6G892_9PEZI|nr:hypothetical protein BDZ85DRAFT_283025 [Elsinoe ampelina]